ncbi:MAG: hypothetical protein RL477_754 [Pseudomonadota bacterium]|jgi:hypothetical protein
MIEFALLLQVLVFAAVCLTFVASRDSSFFHPIVLYLLFHFLVFVARPLMVHFFNFTTMWRYMEFTPNEFQFLDTLAVSSAGLVIFCITAWYAGRVRTEFVAQDLPQWTVPEKRSFLVVLALVGPFAVYSAIFAKGGISLEGEGNIQMTKDLATGIAVYTNTTGYLADAHTMMGTLFILFLWRFNFRLWAYAPFLAFLAYRAFLGWGRWAMIVSVMSLLLIFLYRHHRRWLNPKYLLIIVPVFILFQSLGMNRDLVRNYVEEKGVALADAPVYQKSSSFIDDLDNPDFGNFEYLAFVLSVVPERSQTYTYFTQYLQLFTEPIPRMLWPEKPIGAPITLINLNDFGNFFGMTTSLVGDGWMSLGWIGMLLTLGASGLGLGALHRWFWHNQTNPRSAMIYFVFLPLTISWYRDGGIGIAKVTLWTILPILLWSFFSKLIAGLQGDRPRFRFSLRRQYRPLPPRPWERRK